MNRNALRPFAVAFIVLATLVVMASAVAQPLSGLRAKADAGPVVNITAYSSDDVQSLLTAARKQLEAIEAGGETPPDAPPGAPSSDILQRLTLARLLVSTFEKQLSALEKSEVARQRRMEAQRANDAWRGLTQPPPYSILLVDQARDEVDAAKNALTGAKANKELFQRLERDYESSLKSSQGAARLAVEEADRARGTPAFLEREWNSSLATLRSQVDSAVKGLLQIALRGAQADADAAEAAIELANRRLDDIGTNVYLPRSDLDRVMAEIDARRSRGVSALDAAIKASDAAAKAAERAAPGTLPRADAPAAAPTTSAGGLAATVAREVASTASQRVFLLREYLLQLDGEKATWEARASALDAHNAVRSRAAYDKLTESLASLRATKQYLEQQLTATEARLRDEEARQHASKQGETPASRLLVDTLRQRQNDLRKALDDALPLSRLVSHFRDDFEDRRESSLGAQLQAQWAAVRLAGREVWNFELFAIDDTFETAEGRKLAVSRSVTIGKTFGAALIVVVGYWLCNLILRLVERKAVAKGRATPQGAALARKWILFAVVAILALVGLLSASIPLTAFAFLGGALAIAAGFGLQTLLKNLVCGVMLLIERPLRLGDLVEVDGIRGRVTEIGIRASTIRGGDGIESMIPNSRFLEGNMTNWTYSNSQARQTVALGVAYGSPLRKVVEILGDALERHGLVLKDPKPQVYLDAYADNSINFSLTYWVEMSETGDPRRVKSDLLLMIDRAFDDAGISIPFPQRDVRLATAEPVRVSVVRAAAPRAEAKVMDAQPASR